MSIITFKGVTLGSYFTIEEYHFSTHFGDSFFIVNSRS